MMLERKTLNFPLNSFRSKLGMTMAIAPNNINPLRLSVRFNARLRIGGNPFDSPEQGKTARENNQCVLTPGQQLGVSLV